MMLNIIATSLDATQKRKKPSPRTPTRFKPDAKGDPRGSRAMGVPTVFARGLEQLDPFDQHVHTDQQVLIIRVHHSVIGQQPQHHHHHQPSTINHQPYPQPQQQQQQQQQTTTTSITITQQQ
jgi:hypothetical protein